jgi:hypothetical protein
MRLLFAGCVGAFVGLLQLFAIMAIEFRAGGPSGIDSSELAFPIFGALVFAEIIGVIALSMYRVAPWILRLLRADWEEQKVREGGKVHSGWLVRLVVVTSLLRRAVVMIDARLWSFDLLLSLGVALLCLLVPTPKAKPKRSSGT